MGVTGISDGAVTGTGSRGTKYWTRTTLATHIMGSVPGARNASGGAVPDRLDDVIAETFGYLWELAPWNWRRVWTTLTTAASTATLALPSDYDYSDQLHLSETSDNGPLHLTTNVAEFDDVRQAHTTNGVADTGQPVLAYCEVDSTASEYRRQLRIVPSADGVYVYRMYYYSLAPDLGATDVAKWPPFMFRLWKTLVQAIAEKMLAPNDDRWKSTYAFFKSQLETAQQNNDRDMATQTPECRTGLGDWLAAMGMGG